MEEQTKQQNPPDRAKAAMRKAARTMMIGIQVTFAAWWYLLGGTYIIYRQIIREFFRGNIEVYREMAFNSIYVFLLNILILCIQIPMLMRQFAPQLGLKSNKRFDYDENIAVKKEENETAMVRDRKIFETFLKIYLVILAACVGLELYSIKPGFDYLMHLGQFYSGICFILFYVVYTYITFTGKYYVMESYADIEDDINDGNKET